MAAVTALRESRIDGGSGISGPETGSEIVFYGRVRASEHGETIRALYYEHYAGMAESQLALLAEKIIAEHNLDSLDCLHRVGEVPVGEAAVRVVVCSRHRAEGLAGLAAFILQLKRDVPIWKWGVRPNGERFPSTHCEGCADPGH